MNPPRSLMAVLAIFLTACGSADAPEPQSESTIRELAVATDVDPAPDVVRIRLAAAPGITEFVTGRATSILGYRDGALMDSNPTVPGPLVHANVGDRLVVEFSNELPTFSTTVHWHGLRLPPDMDGNPAVSGVVAPGETFEYAFTLRDAGLFWYHPHVDTDVQLALGLQGLLLVHERDPPTVDRERVFVLDDVSLAADGSVDIELTSDAARFGRRGSVITINGGPPGRIVARPGSVERWRFVNTSNGRYFDVGAAGVPLSVIGSDTGFSPLQYDADALRIAPGERYDVLVEIPATLDAFDVETREVDRGGGETDFAAHLFEVHVEGDNLDSERPVITADFAALDVDGAAVRTFALSSDLEGPAAPAFFINNERWPLNTAITARSGDVDAWDVVNEGDHHHPFHVHGLFFQVLDASGDPDPVLGWKDTVDIAPQSTVRLAVPYGERGRWMFHCQIPEHTERGMAGAVLVE